MEGGVERVEMKWSEIYAAAQVGIRRRIMDLRGGRSAFYGAEQGPEWEYDVVGAIGEAAVAKHLNLYWDGSLGELGASDVQDIEARTRSEDWHELILHDRDEGQDLFILCYVIDEWLPEVGLVGWCWAKNFQTDEYWKDPAGGRPAYFVPPEELLPMPLLYGEVKPR